MPQSLESLYHFCPNIDDKYYSQIMGNACEYLVKKAGYDESEVAKMPMKDAYLLFVQQQRDKLTSQPIGPTIESLIKNGKSFLDKYQSNAADLDEYESAFDDYYRYFPEEILNLAFAQAYYSSNYEKLKEDLGYFNVYNRVSNILQHYQQCGGNTKYITNLYFKLRNYICNKLRLSYFFPADRLKGTKFYDSYVFATNLYKNLSGNGPYESLLKNYDSLCQVVCERLSDLRGRYGRLSPGSEDLFIQQETQIEEVLANDIEIFDKDSVGDILKSEEERKVCEGMSTSDKTDASKIVCDYVLESIGQIPLYDKRMQGSISHRTNLVNSRGM